MAVNPGFMNQVLQPKLKGARNAANERYLKAQGEIRSGYDEAMGYQRPWYDYGQKSLTDFQTWGSDPNAITSDPSYKWRLGQGTEALENSAAARGGLLSGNTGKALTEYGQNAASQEYANEFDRWLKKLGIGERASGNMASLSSDKGNALARMLAHEGDKWWSNTADMARIIRDAEEGFNNILQSWVPASAGGGKPQQNSPSSGGGDGGGGLDSSYQGTSDSFGQQYSGGDYGGGYF